MMLSRIMEDYGYTFNDMSKMTQRQLNFLLSSKLARMKVEQDMADEQQKEAAKQERSMSRGKGKRTIGNRR